MDSSRRERYMMIAAAAVLGAFVLDSFVLTPVLAWRSDLAQRHALMAITLEKAQALVANRPRLERRWRDMVEGGMRDNVGDAEAAVYHAIRDWSRDSGLQLQAINPERVTLDSELPHVVMRASASGPMRAMARFLERVEEAPFPIRVTQMQLASRREGEDDLTVQLQLSTLVHRIDPDKAGRPSPATDGLGNEALGAALSEENAL